MGIELCEKILEGKYEYILATHVDKDHIHNHIIFNSIDIGEGKVYHSYYGSYMNIRNQSDKLCKEYNLSVIDQETEKEINEIKRRKFVNWYDWNEDKKGKSYKSRLQFDIDRTIKCSINWQDFLSKMESCGYEIKQGKHIAFRNKNQKRFTRAKTIGDNYTEERIKERILNKDKELGNIIDLKNNDKAKLSKGYEHWATKHNLKTAASTLVEIRNKGFKLMEELERGISRISIEKNELKREFDKLSWEQKRIKEVVKQIQICISKREHYEGYRKNPNDKIYMMMNRKDVEAYQKSYEEIDVFLKQFPHLRHVETVVLLSHKKPDSQINVKVEFGDENGKFPIESIAEKAEEYKPKEKVTYKMIQSYIKEKYNLKMHTAYIAEVKRNSGMKMQMEVKSEGTSQDRKSHPSKEKVEIIKDALSHFNLI